MAGGTPDGPLDSDRYGAGVTTTTQALIFYFDGTMVDSDDALIQPFLALGVPLEEISFGHAIAEECDRLGISRDAYADLYDEVVVQPFPDMSDVVQRPLRDLVEAHRDEIKAIVARHHGRSVAIFGSVARGDERPGSDIDFLVELEPDARPIEILSIGVELEEARGVKVDVGTPASLRERLRDEVLAEALRL